MKIVVCLKQIPRLDRIEFDRANRIVRENVEAMTNPLDLQALGHALRLRDEHGGEVVAMSMGPPQASEALEDAMRRGADRAVHLVDRKFAGSDTLATARALCRALRREQPDLVLFGRSTLDGATAQVPPQVAELLGLPYVGHVTAIEAGDDGLHLEREVERGRERWSAPLPAAASVERGPEPGAEADGEVEVEEVTAEDLGGTPRDYGTRGSPTFVKEVRKLSAGRDQERVDDVEDAAERVRALLPSSEDRHAPMPSGAGGAEGGAQIWVVAERDGDGLHPVSLEGLACAAEVAAQLSAEVVAVLPCAEPGDLPARLAAHGAERVLVVRHERLDNGEPAALADALAAAIDERGPLAVIAPWTADGRDWAPRVAARLGLGLTGDFVRLEVPEPDDDDPDLLWIKPAWAGTVQAPIISHRSPSLGTLRPGAFPIPETREDADAEIEELAPELGGEDGAHRDERRLEIEDERPLDAARIVICLGPDADDDAARCARVLAGRLGGAVGATAEAVERGRAPEQMEIGITKRSIAPPLVIALGVRDPEALDAVRAAERIVTVHPDVDAPAHERADLAVAADPAELARALVESLGGERTA